MLILFNLIKAWMIGIAIAAPVGPIGVLCIRKTIEMGFLGAVSVGLGAALADSVYGIVAATGLTVISHFLLEEKAVIKIIGGLFLLYLAYREIKSETTTKAITTHSSKAFRLELEVFFLTLTNPMTILSFIAIFSSISGDSISYIGSLIMVIGIFLGSMTWWLVLGGVVCRIRHSLPKIWLERIKYLSALILASFGVLAIFG